MEFRVLGPIEVLSGGEPVEIRTGRTRSLLALLLLESPRTVAADRIVDLLWVDPPSRAKAQVHNLISRLRQEMGQLIVSHSIGYRIELAPPHTFDLARFRGLADEGGTMLRAGDAEGAAAVLTAALECWRGTALTGAVEPLVSAFGPALERERLHATEIKLDAELAVGRYDSVLTDVGALLAEHPHWEQLYRRQMLALAGLGRRDDALAAYQVAYRRLVDDLGVEPGADLRELHQELLDGTTRAAAVMTAAVPRQLPPAVEPLSGRDELLATIRKALGGRPMTPPVVVLTGPGGVGKTALAVHAAHLAADDFADGQLYAELRGSHETPVEPHDVIGRFLRALGVPGSEVPGDHDERVARFRSELSGRRALIVLDDAGDEAQVRPLVPGGARCAVVITSRRRLDALPRATTLAVPTLAPADAVGLLTEQAGRDRTEGAAAAEVARLCGHLPLALHIAGARLAARPDWTIAQLRDRLAGQRARLDELTVGDLDVRASIELSYRSLGAGLSAVFRRLGLLDAISFPSWVVAAVAGSPGGSGERQLNQLLGCHLVMAVGTDQAGQPRFRLHDLVHEFALERALAEDPASVRDETVARVLAGWLALAGEAASLLEPSAPRETGPAASMPAVAAVRAGPYDWFEAERVNLVAAVRQALRLGRPQLAGDLVTRFNGFLLTRDYLADHEAITRAVIDSWPGTDRRLMRLLGNLFSTYGQQDRNDELPAIADRMMAVADELGDEAALLEALAHSSAAAARLGRLRSALRVDRRCVAEARRLGLPDVEIAHYERGLAITLVELGSAAEALPLLRRCLAAGPASERSRAMLLADHADALIAEGLLDQATETLAEAREVVGRIGDEVGSARVEIFLADVAIARGLWPQARDRLEQALDVLSTHHDLNGRCYALRRLAEVALGEGRADLARRQLEQALELAHRMRAPVEVARTLIRLSAAWDLLGDTERARDRAGECRRILAELDLPTGCLRMPPHLRAVPTGGMRQ